MNNINYEEIEIEMYRGRSIESILDENTDDNTYLDELEINFRKGGIYVED